MHGRETPPSSSTLETDRGGGAQRREPQGEGMERELGEEWKLRGAAGLGKGLKTPNTG